MNMPKPPLHHRKPIRPGVTHGRDQLAHNAHTPPLQMERGPGGEVPTPHCPNCSLPLRLLHWDGEVYKCTECGGSWAPPAIQKYPEIFLDEKEGEETVAPSSRFVPAEEGPGQVGKSPRRTTGGNGASKTARIPIPGPARPIPEPMPEAQTQAEPGVGTAKQPELFPLPVGVKPFSEPPAVLAARNGEKGAAGLQLVGLFDAKVRDLAAIAHTLEIM